MKNGRGKLRDDLLVGMGFALMLAALYMALVYAPTEKYAGAVQRIFYFHVPLAWVGFLAFLVVFIGSILYLWKRSVIWDSIAWASAEVGVVFTSLVLITGSIWAKAAWGIWWTWDARLTATLVLWFVYVAYLMVRGYAREESQGARLSAVLGIVGFINVPIVALAINLWRTQHPTALIFEGGLAPTMLVALLVCVVAFTVLYILLVRQATSLKILESDIENMKNLRLE
ncbi:MAG TPA: cytochrome c biogenesis protein CcsA [Dehalococcoidales bacterium]|nr:cytochrome c biogenesis protein CcsA [Dehalococcoidales bacterium]